jgi:hypothetical protein
MHPFLSGPLNTIRRWKRAVFWTTALGAAAGVVVAFWLVGAESNPVSIFELRDLVEAHGFFTCATLHQEEPGGDLVCRSLVISRTPISHEEAAELVFTVPSDPNWRGRVRVLRTDTSIRFVYPSPHAVVGSLHFFGDKDAIRAIQDLMKKAFSPGGRG